MKLSKLLLVPFVVLGMMGGAGAQAPRSYAVLSLVGDTLTLQANRHAVGSHTDSAPKQVLAMDDQLFDQLALIAARSWIAEKQPGAKAVLMATQDKGLYRAQNEMFELPDAHQDDRDYLKSLLKDQGVSHLVLISKFRSNALVELQNANIGAGALEGLGFYVDDTLNIRDTATKDVGRGIMMPYAYVRVRLLDAQTLAVVREVTARKSRIMMQPSVESSGMDGFNGLNGTEKAKHIRTVLDDAMAGTLPDLLAQ